MSALTSDQITEISNYINTYRAIHQSPPLTWDDSIASFSQQWSNTLLTGHIFQHSGNESYGENLAYYEGYGTDVMTLLKKAVHDWYNEHALYDYNNPGFSSGTGHFTCLVWKSSTRFGMGISIDTATTKVDVTMNTSPPGNYEGEFAINVLPSVSISISLPPPTPLLSPTLPSAPVLVPPGPTTIVPPRPSTVPPGPTTIVPAGPTAAQISPPNLYDLITSVYNIIYAIQMRQPRPLIINALYKTINSLPKYTQLGTGTQRQIYLLLSKVTMGIQQQGSKPHILQTLQEVLGLLNRYVQTV
jgi:hypothetical protein